MLFAIVFGFVFMLIFITGDVQQIALQANATSLSTGRYSYSVQVVDERSTNTTATYSGSATVLNQSTSAFGDGWTLEGLEQVVSTGSGGVILTLGDNGETLWFSGSPSVGGNYTSPAGEFSTLTLTSSGYTRTRKRSAEPYPRADRQAGPTGDEGDADCPNPPASGTSRRPLVLSTAPRGRFVARRIGFRKLPVRPTRSRVPSLVPSLPTSSDWPGSGSSPGNRPGTPLTW